MGSVPIVNHLSREMGARRLSIREVVRRTGLSYSAMHDLYHGRVRRIDFATLDKLCRALDVKVGDILEYDPWGAEPDSGPVG